MINDSASLIIFRLRESYSESDSDSKRSHSSFLKKFLYKCVEHRLLHVSDELLNSIPETNNALYVN